jgi:hypothetical protein
MDLLEISVERADPIVPDGRGDFFDTQLGVLEQFGGPLQASSPEVSDEARARLSLEQTIQMRGRQADVSGHSAQANPGIGKVPDNESHGAFDGTVTPFARRFSDSGCADVRRAMELLRWRDSLQELESRVGRLLMRINARQQAQRELQDEMLHERLREDAPRTGRLVHQRTKLTENRRSADEGDLSHQDLAVADERIEELTISSGIRGEWVSVCHVQSSDSRHPCCAETVSQRSELQFVGFAGEKPWLRQKLKRKQRTSGGAPPTPNHDEAEGAGSSIKRR